MQTMVAWPTSDDVKPYHTGPPVNAVVRRGPRLVSARMRSSRTKVTAAPRASSISEIYAPETAYRWHVMYMSARYGVIPNSLAGTLSDFELRRNARTRPQKIVDRLIPNVSGRFEYVRGQIGWRFLLENLRIVRINWH